MQHSFSVYYRAKEEYIIVDEEVRTSVRQDKLEYTEKLISPGHKVGEPRPYITYVKVQSHQLHPPKEKNGDYLHQKRNNQNVGQSILKRP